MSAPNPVLYETGTDTPLDPWSFGTALPASETSEKEFDLANVGASAETMTEVSLGVEESDDSGVTWHQDGPLTLERWVQLQAYDVDGAGIVAQTTPWTPVGVGARLRLKPIPADCRRLLRAQIVLPAGISSAVKYVKIVVYWREGYQPLSQGFAEAGIHGVCGGTGDPEHTQLLAGGALTETGTPDGNVQVAPVQWKSRGIPHADYGGAVAIAASGSGLARWVTLSLGDSWPPTQTASTAVTAPAPVTDRPAVPDGEALLGWVHRDDGTIVTADLYTEFMPDALRLPLIGPFGLLLDGLDAAIGPGFAIVDNRLVWRDRSTPFTLADDQETIFYVGLTGAPEAVAAGDSPTAPRAEPIWSATVAGGVVTATRDLRRFLGPQRHTFDAFFTGAAVDDAAVYWTSPIDVRLYVMIPRGVTLSARVIGDRTAGALHVPLEYWDGAAWTSLFSSTSKDPQLAYNATVLAVGGFIPDRVEVAPATRLRFRQETTSLTGGATNPSDVYVRVDFEEGGL